VCVALSQVLAALGQMLSVAVSQVVRGSQRSAWNAEIATPLVPGHRRSFSDELWCMCAQKQYHNPVSIRFSHNFSVAISRLVSDEAGQAHAEHKITKNNVSDAPGVLH